MATGSNVMETSGTIIGFSQSKAHKGYINLYIDPDERIPEELLPSRLVKVGFNKKTAFKCKPAQRCILVPAGHPINAFPGQRVKCTVHYMEYVEPYSQLNQGEEEPGYEMIPHPLMLLEGEIEVVNHAQQGSKTTK